MPDSFEIANAALGLNPSVADGNGGALSQAFIGVAGCTNLECYLNALADGSGGTSTLFADGFE